MSISRKTDIAPRQVDFSLFRGDARLVEGTFTVMTTPAVSCFGKHREIPIKDKKERAVLFEGLVLEHQLNVDGSASIGLKFFATEPSPDSSVWYRQTVEVAAALSMGSVAGSDKLESVVLGDSYEFVFRSHTLS